MIAERKQVWRVVLSVNRMAGSLLTLCAVLACGSDTSGPTPTAPENAYWALRLNYPAVNMAKVAPYNTVHLVATPLNAVGAPISGASAIRYTVNHQYDVYVHDSSIVVDSITGVVTAKDSSTQGQYSIRQVVASLTIDGVTHTDTVNIRVTAAAPSVPITTLAFPAHAAGMPLVLKGSLLYGSLPMVTAKDAHGDSIPVSTRGSNALLVSCTSSILAVASFDGILHGCDIATHEFGAVTLYATTLAYGTVIRDTVQAQVGYQIFEYINVVPYTPVNSLTRMYRFIPPNITVMVGGVVDFLWRGFADDSVDVVFDDSTSIMGGREPFFPGGLPTITQPGNISNVNARDELLGDTVIYTRIAKRFSTAGAYRYHSRKYGTGGVVYVSDTLLTTLSTP